MLGGVKEAFEMEARSHDVSQLYHAHSYDIIVITTLLCSLDSEIIYKLYDSTRTLCMYVCMYMHIRILHTRTYPYTYIYVHSYTYIHIRTYIIICMYISYNSGKSALSDI